VTVTRNDNTGRSVDSMLWDQLTVTLRWSIGGIDNTSVVGIEGWPRKSHAGVRQQ